MESIQKLAMRGLETVREFPERSNEEVAIE